MPALSRTGRGRLPWVTERALPLAEGPTRLLDTPHGAVPDLSDMTGRIYPARHFAKLSDQEKVRRIRQMIEEYGTDPRLRFFVVNQILKPAGITDYRQDGQAQRIAQVLLKWVQDNIFYANEPDEQLQSPWWTLKVKIGDCDDCTILLGAMAHSIRVPWRLRLGGLSRCPGGPKCAHDRAWSELRTMQQLVQQGRAVPVTREWKRALATSTPTPHAAPTTWTEGERYPAMKAAHIYLDLGWPPFSEGKKRPDGRPVTDWLPAFGGRGTGMAGWATAEPSMRGLPLGYDVILQGLPGQRQGRRLNELAGADALGAPPWAFGAVAPVDLDAETAEPDAATIDVPLPPLPFVKGRRLRVNLGDLVLSTAEGVLVALILSWLERRRR